MKIYFAGLYDDNDKLIASWKELTDLGLLFSQNDPDLFYANQNYKIFKEHNLSGKLVIPNGFTMIYANVLNNCDTLTGIRLPNSVTSISNFAFENCSALKEIRFSKNLAYIGKCAFKGCRSLEEIVLPQSLKKVDSFAFSDCTSLRKVVFSPNTKHLGAQIFKNCPYLQEIYISQDALANNPEFKRDFKYRIVII